MLKIKDVDMLNNVDLVYDNKIFLYGAGDYGYRAVKLLDQLEIPIYGISDSDERLWGTFIKGHEIQPVKEWVEQCKKEPVTVVITVADPNSIEQILQVLEGYRLFNADFYTYFALKTTIELHLCDSRIKETFREDFLIAKRTYYDFIKNDLEDRAREFIFSVMLHDLIVVWQPGKVGSTSIARSLKAMGIHYTHMHCLAFHNWVDLELRNACGISHYWESEPIEKLDILKKSEKVKIISLVRDPIARSVADYFEGLGTLYSKYDNIDRGVYQELNDFIGREAELGECGYIFEWFNQEIKAFFDIDVYQYPFDKEKGYQVVCKDNVELLLIKTEKLSGSQDVLGQFIGNKDFKLLDSNVGNQKTYKFAYEEVKNTIRIPEHIIDFYYRGNKAMDHFYTEEEKKRLIQKWCH